MAPTAALSGRIGAQVLERARLLARHTDSPHCLTRGYLTPAHHGAAAQLAQWMREAGMQVRRDAADVFADFVGHFRGRP